jgi:sporulation protein YlmC with PRC-barrel domain
MVDVPMSAKVECADGPGGQSVGVVLDPKTWQVTHFVIEEGGPSLTERLVSVDWVTETTPDSVRLRCSKSELAAMQPFAEMEYHRMDRSTFVGGPYCGWYGWPYVFLETMLTPAKRERVPPGELAVRRGARVKATDGQVGQVDEFLVDPTSRHITHLVLREGHLWGQKDVTIPVSEIERAGEATVYLKLDKQAIESLPAVPVRQWHSRKAA